MRSGAEVLAQIDVSGVRIRFAGVAPIAMVLLTVLLQPEGFVVVNVIE